MNALEIVKRYPVPAVIAVVAVIGGVVLFSGDGNEALSGQRVSIGADANAVAAANSLNMASIQAQSRNNEIAATVGMQKENLAAQYQLAQLQATTGLSNNNLLAELERYKIDKETALEGQKLTLTADTRGKELALQGQIEQGRNEQSIRTQEIYSQLVMAQTNATVQIAQINKPQRGLFSFLFG